MSRRTAVMSRSTPSAVGADGVEPGDNWFIVSEDINNSFVCRLETGCSVSQVSCDVCW